MSDKTPDKPGAFGADALRFHEVLEELYRRPGTSPGSIDPETGRFLYSLARLACAELVVEVGTQHGLSTLWLARAVADNGQGRVLALDLFRDPPADEVRRTIKRAGLAAWAELVPGPSVTVGAEACRRAGRPIDFLYIDGDHRVEGCAADFETLGALVRPGGFVVLHDIYPDRCGWDGPRYVLDFLARNPAVAQNWQILELPARPRSPYGLAVLRKLFEGQTRILPRPVYWLYKWRMVLSKWLRLKRTDAANNPPQAE